MSDVMKTLLIVDDDQPLRDALSQFFSECGYRVGAAADGFAALSEMRKQIPDIVLSDLNMPGMSGFEFLSVVRRRFPSIRVIAMSGEFSGAGVPPGVAADAFCEKGSNFAPLLQIMEAMTRDGQYPLLDQFTALAPIWIPRNGHDDSGRPYVLITCPECLRIFPQVFLEDAPTIRNTDCVYCSSPIRYGIVPPDDPLSSQTFQRKPGSGSPTALAVPGLES